jgi:hypothetical protein
MGSATYYVQPCPICGRRLQIRVEYLGKQVSCRHCGGQFVASDPVMRRMDLPQPTSELLQRAERLLHVPGDENSRGR